MLFFFSSRRRHTRFDCDWSSDVCSSDLALFLTAHDALNYKVAGYESGGDDYLAKPFSPRELEFRVEALLRRRSEERRVGKECRWGGGWYSEKYSTKG